RIEVCGDSQPRGRDRRKGIVYWECFIAGRDFFRVRRTERKMGNPAADVALAAIMCGTALIISLTVIGTRAWHKVEAMKHQSVQGKSELASTVAELKREVAQLRDTTTRYDMAFDTALERLESRIAQVEKNSRATSTDTEQVVTR